jgi:hypothetical protein
MAKVTLFIESKTGNEQITIARSVNQVGGGLIILLHSTRVVGHWGYPFDKEFYISD